MTWWIALAYAAEPEVGVLGVGEVGHSEQWSPRYGVEGVGALGFNRFHLELAAGVGLETRGGFWLRATPRARVFLGDPKQPVLSIFGGVGADIAGAVDPVLVTGASLDVFKSGGPRPRVQAQYALSPSGQARLSLGVGAVFGRKGEPPPPPPKPTPKPDMERPRLSLMEPGMIWVPGPVCQWLPADDASDAINERGLRLDRLNVVTASSLRGLEPLRAPDKGQEASPGGGEDPEPGPDAPPEPVPGQIVVVTSANDRVELAGEAVPVENGVAIGSHPEGRAEVVIIGGGRRLTLPVGVVIDHAVWLTSTAPEPQRVQFDVNNTTLRGKASKRVQEIAENAGGWSFEVHGSYSPEGDVADNQALARQRAEAVRDALVDSGVPGDRIVLGEPAPPDPELSAAEQRNAVITPMETP